MHGYKYRIYLHNFFPYATMARMGLLPERKVIPLQRRAKHARHAPWQGAVTRLEARWKLSQNRDEPDQLGVMVSGTLAMLFIAAGMLVIGALDSVAGLYLGTAIWALGISVQYPALLVAALADVPDSERATATSTFTMFFEISGGIGGPLLGVTAALAGVRASFAVSAASALVGLALLRTLVAGRLR